MPYSKLYNLTKLSANAVNFISVNKQKLDLSKYIYAYGTVKNIFSMKLSSFLTQQSKHMFLVPKRAIPSRAWIAYVMVEK